MALVTGGASGLGRATAIRFANKGAKVVFCDLPTSNGEAVAKEIGENAHYIPADVTSETDVQNLVDEISKKYGKLNLLVNCAGRTSAHVSHNSHAGRTINLESFKNVLFVCFNGLVLSAHYENIK